MKAFPSRYLCLIGSALLLAVFTCTAEASSSHHHHRQRHHAVARLHRHPVSRAHEEARAPASYLLEVNGEVYREKDANVRRAPASLTKIMTALLVLEKCPPDQVVTVDTSASRETGSRIGLRKGEKLTVHDLLAATLMASANDAARALADHVSGSQQAFVVLMNSRAHELQMENTRFTNVCGHDAAGHYSTVHDLAILTGHALKQPLFAELVSRPVMRISSVNGKRSYTFKNLNRLIGHYPGAVGVKTGTTHGAGQCLVALAKRDQTQVLLVMMRARNRWRVAPALLDEVFAKDRAEKIRQETEKRSEGNEALPERALVRDKEEAPTDQHHP